MTHFFSIWLLLFVWTILLLLAVDSPGAPWAKWVGRLAFLIILPLVIAGNIACGLQHGWARMLQSAKEDWRSFVRGTLA